MEAGDQGGPGFERATEFAPQAATDRMLEEADGRFEVGGVVCGGPQERRPPRDRSVESGQAPGDDALVGHRVEELDLKLAGVAAGERRGPRVGGGAAGAPPVG